ncbi:hypothetical protein E2C01_057542 [Portunus trituberculatus]|uniref:Uncharacterized protein n=1 Tax=Portunus trituberculatus TaxID=210409 RepID=A0A5B7H3M4_PORTR|nr:hypothetical protein [Portunus trituberculatus]
MDLALLWRKLRPLVGGCVLWEAEYEGVQEGWRPPRPGGCGKIHDSDKSSSVPREHTASLLKTFPDERAISVLLDQEGGSTGREAPQPWPYIELQVLRSVPRSLITMNGSISLRHTVCCVCCVWRQNNYTQMLPPKDVPPLKILEGHQLWYMVG